MVTSPDEWKILEWDDKLHATNKQTNMLKHRLSLRRRDRRSPSQFSVGPNKTVLTPTLFGINYYIHSSLPPTGSICIHVMMANCSTWTDFELNPKPPVLFLEICYSLHADDVTFASHTHNGLQRLMDNFSKPCVFGLIISIKKTLDRASQLHLQSQSRARH